MATQCVVAKPVLPLCRVRHQKLLNATPRAPGPPYLPLRDLPPPGQALPALLLVPLQPRLARQPRWVPHREGTCPGCTSLGLEQSLRARQGRRPQSCVHRRPLQPALHGLLLGPPLLLAELQRQIAGAGRVRSAHAVPAVGGDETVTVMTAHIG